MDKLSEPVQTTIKVLISLGSFGIFLFIASRIGSHYRKRRRSVTSHCDIELNHPDSPAITPTVPPGDKSAWFRRTNENVTFHVHVCDTRRLHYPFSGIHRLSSLERVIPLVLSWSPQWLLPQRLKTVRKRTMIFSSGVKTRKSLRELHSEFSTHLIKYG